MAYIYDLEARRRGLERRMPKGVAALACRAVSSGNARDLADYVRANPIVTDQDRFDVAYALFCLSKNGRGRPPAQNIQARKELEFKIARSVRHERDRWLAQHPGRKRLPKGMPQRLATKAIAKENRRLRDAGERQLEEGLAVQNTLNLLKRKE